MFWGFFSPQRHSGTEVHRGDCGVRASEAGSIEIAGDSESADCLRRARTPSAQGFTRASDPFSYTVLKQAISNHFYMVHFFVEFKKKESLGDNFFMSFFRHTEL